MILKKRPLKNCRLYLILNAKRNGKGNLIRIAGEAIRGGVDIIQLRWKDSEIKAALEIGRVLRRITDQAGILFIINDRVDLGQVLNADGIHLGQEDLPLECARSIFGRDKIIGVSAHSLNQARDAAAIGADYISIGPVFSTPTKPEYKPVGLNLVKQISKNNVDVPFFAIGGIRINNMRAVLAAGAKRVAVVRAIMDAQDIRRAATAIKAKLVESVSSVSGLCR